MNKLNGELFFNRCGKKFNNKFIYHNDYNGMDKPIRVTCPVHGDFQTLSEHHWQSKDGGCLSCQKDKHMLKYINNGNVFIEKSKFKHDNKYDYSKTNYINNETNVIIICPEHGEFIKKPTCHLNRGQGCIECSKKTMGGYGGYNPKNAEKFKNDWSNKRGFIYIVEMGDEFERFIKIGITVQKNILRRFSGFKYKITILDFIEDSLYNLVYKEREILEKFKNYKYVPKQYFKGHQECFNLEICENLKNI